MIAPFWIESLNNKLSDMNTVELIPISRTLGFPNLLIVISRTNPCLRWNWFTQARFIRRTSAVSNSIQLSEVEMRRSWFRRRISAEFNSSNWYCRVWKCYKGYVTAFMADQDTERRLFILFCKKLLKEGEEGGWVPVTTEPVAMVKISFPKLSLEQMTSTMSTTCLSCHCAFLPRLFFFCGAKYSFSDK